MNNKEGSLKKFADRTAVVGILGLGYVGLPLAVVFADAGFKVIGIDPIQIQSGRTQPGEKLYYRRPHRIDRKACQIWCFCSLR